MKDLAKYLPESRKLRVLMATIVAYFLNLHWTFLQPDQIETLVNLIMVWIGGQSLADMGLQGKIREQVRAMRKGVKPVDHKDDLDITVDTSELR